MKSKLTAEGLHLIILWITISIKYFRSAIIILRRAENN